jgi:hypothetical protein
MLSEQTLPSVLGLFAGTLYNPNNVTDEAAPITVSLEIEVGQMVATMLGYNPKRCWAHLTSGGTIANIEALWVARLVQFVPLTVKEFCQSRGIPFTIKRADGLDVKIEDLSTSELIGLRPNEALFMLRKLAAFIHNTYRQPYPEILADINLAVSSSTTLVQDSSYSEHLRPFVMSYDSAVTVAHAVPSASLAELRWCVPSCQRSE